VGDDWPGGLRARRRSGALIVLVSAEREKTDHQRKGSSGDRRDGAERTHHNPLHPS